MAYGFYRARAKASLFAVETVEEQQTVWDKVISELFIKKVHDLIGKDMKINAIVGNPPYQINDGSGASDDAANPIYQIFVRIAKQIRPEYFSLIMPSKWMIGGKAVLKPFRKEMMEDKHIASIYDYEDSGECFNGQHIDGGICYFLWSNKHNGKLRYTYISANKEFFVSTRFLSDGNSDIVIRDNRRQSIIAKTSTNCSLFKEIVSLTQPFGIRKDLFNSPERYPLSNLQAEPFYGSVKIYGVKGIKGGARRTIGYISPEIITKNKAAVNKYKLFFTTSYSTNAFNPPETIIGEQNSVCTETFLLIGPFDTEIEQKNCYKYICTNFFKALLFFGRGTMQVSQDVFRFIPLQDFSNQSDIKWNKSISEIDQQLCIKYAFTQQEVLSIDRNHL